ncbi:glycosyltransferase family 2 protein [Nocardioides houyundeii]|uniref:glycosyltransferase family 2 protein n=1 Tax=Nocardioides houyundeii TaxID=2045452 RepID=UPI000C763358|nr:glycosyltransferase family 2 protein [Nocardioides houyundeii]
MAPSPSRERSVTVQSILYGTELGALERTLEALDTSAALARRDGLGDGLRVVLGDASPHRLVSDEVLAGYRSRFGELESLDYLFFGENTGTAKGHNTMARLTDSAYLVTSNPDIVPDARALWRMLDLFEDPSTGMVEAKQLPVEHPKEYDVATGETGWAATAFAMTPRDLFDELGGFDEQTFFMYCDDVDYSWLVREAGRVVRFQPAALAFHDKRLSLTGAWQPTSAETFYSAQAALLLAHKWSREDVVERVLADFGRSTIPEYADAVAEFERRRDAGLLVAQHDPEHRVGYFADGYYTKHRYAL